MERGLLWLWLPLLCLISIGCATEQDVSETVRVDLSPSVADRFVGSWTLASWTRSSSSGEIRHPYGEDAFGRIMYQPNGRMMVVLMRRDRPGVLLSDATPEGLRDIIVGSFFSYTGRYTVDQEAGTVTHHVEGCVAPTWVGTDQVREFEFVAEDQIALRPPPNTEEEDEWQSELIWQREN